MNFVYEDHFTGCSIQIEITMLQSVYLYATGYLVIDAIYAIEAEGPHRREAYLTVCFFLSFPPTFLDIFALIPCGGRLLGGIWVLTWVQSIVVSRGMGRAKKHVGSHMLMIFRTRCMSFGVRVFLLACKLAYTLHRQVSINRERNPISNHMIKTDSTASCRQAKALDWILKDG